MRYGTQGKPQPIEALQYRRGSPLMCPIAPRQPEPYQTQQTELSQLSLCSVIGIMLWRDQGSHTGRFEPSKLEPASSTFTACPPPTGSI